MSDEFIEVRITASQTVQYAQTVQMRAADYEEYKRLVATDAKDSLFESLAERYLDLSDISSADHLEDVEVRKWEPRSCQQF